jgi:peroxisomal 2,4-dienoyl-CoA reductase
MAQRYIQPAAPPSEQTFQKDLFVGKVVLSTGGRSGIVNKMIRMMMKHGADSVIIGRK